MEGIKYDNEKPKADIVLSDFSRALIEVCKVGTIGIEKYSAGNWVHVQDGMQRYSDAMVRHYLLEKIEIHDAETKKLHAAHVAWNALARLELMLR